MIVEMLLDVFKSIFRTLMVFELPSMPDEVMDFVETAFDYIVAGVGLLANYAPVTYLLALFGMVLALDVAMLLYKLIMWVLKKVPNANVS